MLPSSFVVENSFLLRKITKQQRSIIAQRCLTTNALSVPRNCLQMLGRNKMKSTDLIGYCKSKIVLFFLTIETWLATFCTWLEPIFFS